MTVLSKNKLVSNDAQVGVKSRSIVNSVFFSRLGQRIIHLLSSRTAAGRLYEVDMRLRPNGASGLLVSSLAAYAKYQKNKAWVWEHQALVRARAVTGDKEIIKQFKILRKEVLMQKRNIDELKVEVINIRKKMRTALPKETTELFDIKHSVGGIVDVEFIVQYSVLAWAHEIPELCDYSDNISLLHVLEKNTIIATQDAETLTTIYLKYRQRLHRLSLQDKRGMVVFYKYKKQSQSVKRIWDNIFTTNK